ncbi:hypothetical protein [Pasteurella multocida]|uniref:hypothetical protein n=1 Tax=Pasteurella multocida TaxID=747 RepID=UPI003978514D
MLKSVDMSACQRDDRLFLSRYDSAERADRKGVSLVERVELLGIFCENDEQHFDYIFV